MATTYIHRTPGSAGSATTWTYSVWVKRGTLGGNQRFLSNGNQQGSGSQDTAILFMPDNTLRFDVYDSGVTRGNVDTNRVFRDPSAWYHLLFVWNTTSATTTMNGSATDRMQIWVNGVQETSLTGHTGSAPTIPSQNANDPNTNSTSHAMRIGTREGTQHYFDGCMSHIQFVDGAALAPTEFGETDSTSGIWKIKTDAYATPGTNGFHLKMEDASNLDLDSSSNAHTFTTSGTLTATEDNPSNVFCTMNPLSTGSSITITNGNNTITNSSTTDNSIVGTIACGNGKYFWEAKCTSNTSTYSNIGITLSSKHGGNHSDVDAGRVMWSSNGNLYRHYNSSAVSLGAFGTNDIIGIALDTENGTLKFYKGGVLTHTETNTSFLYSNNEYIPASGLYNSGGFQYNFGNGYFGTSAISSEGTNASGIGKFEYNVPTGYTALSTKGLNE